MQPDETLLSDFTATHLVDDFLILSNIMQWLDLHLSLDFYYFYFEI